jgi:DNA end-binding protein Ku
MTAAARVGVAKLVMRGKESLVLIRPAQGGLMLHTMYYADEVRDFGEIDRGESAKIQGREAELARRLIDELSNEEFRPEQYTDEYRNRVLEVVNQKVEGKEITAAPPQEERTKVIDLMEALRASLEKRKTAPESETASAKKPPARATARADAAPDKPPVPARRRAQAAKQ